MSDSENTESQDETEAPESGEQDVTEYRHGLPRKRKI